ncbi:hypothetical protein M426DRAFT_121625 [Hypoxylon sp. CI-4A]|nr:hypothetical protein M426DRAFT_121625 [Hypoxylon sp. CI-4A]
MEYFTKKGMRLTHLHYAIATEEASNLRNWLTDQETELLRELFKSDGEDIYAWPRLYPGLAHCMKRLRLHRRRLAKETSIRPLKKRRRFLYSRSRKPSNRLRFVPSVAGMLREIMGWGYLLRDPAENMPPNSTVFLPGPAELWYDENGDFLFPSPRDMRSRRRGIALLTMPLLSSTSPRAFSKMNFSGCTLAIQ